MLSAIEKMIFLKEVPFFAELNIEELKIMGGLCEEAFFESNAVIFREGEPGGALYVVVSGRVAIERESQSHREGAEPARLAVLGSHAFFGEMTLFDNSPRSADAVAVVDTLLLKLRREPVIMLARQNPEVSLSLLVGLSQRLHQTSQRIAELIQSKPRELHKFYDKLEG
jgi:CRP-like cAMP-binding protein